MMNDMARPKIIHVMADAMKPVIRKIIGEKKQNPEPPGAVIKRKDSEFINEREQSPDHRFRHKADKHVADAKAQTGECIFCFVRIFIFFVSEPCFYRKQNDKTRNSII